MKTMKKILCLVMAILIFGGLCACGSNSSSESGLKSPEQQARDAVTTRGMMEYFGSSIGGKELKRSSATVTNVKQISDTEFLVSGKMVMTDVYGTNWNNTFDCEVKKSGDSWSAGSFEYTSKNWTKD